MTSAIPSSLPKHPDDPEFGQILDTYFFRYISTPPSPAGFFDWQIFCQTYKQRDIEDASLQGRISKWEPSTEEAKRLKQCFQSLHKSITKNDHCLEQGIANGCRLDHLVTQYKTTYTVAVAPPNISASLPKASLQKHPDDPAFGEFLNDPFFASLEIPKKGFFDWSALREYCLERKDAGDILADRISKWAPTQEDAKRFKHCYLRIHNAITQNTEQLDEVMADMVRVGCLIFLYRMQHPPAPATLTASESKQN